MHVNDQSHVPYHCRIFSLSDKSDTDLKKECDHPHDEVCDEVCDHPHDEVCDRCEALDVALKDIETAVHNAGFYCRDDQEEVFYVCQTSELAIQARNVTS